MKTLNLNSTIKDVEGNNVSIATLQRSVAPAYLAPPAEQETPATYALLVYAGINNYRALEEEISLCYSILTKVNNGVKNNTNIEVEDTEYALIKLIIDNQVIAIRAPFYTMVTELNPL